MARAQQSWMKHQDTPHYRVGDQVWLEGKHLCTHQPTAKLAARRHGPFPILEVLSPVNYRLQLSMQWSVHPVFHTDLLTPYREMTMHGVSYQRPPPDLVEGEEEYEVEHIVDSRHHSRRKTLQYLIKWKGYPDSDNEWVSHKDMHAPDAIREYEACQIKRGVTSVQSPTSLPSSLMILPITSNTILDIADKAVQDAQATAADLAHEGSPITEEELHNLIQRFPGATPATLTPDVDGLENVPNFLRLPPGAKIGYDANAWEGNDDDKCYYIQSLTTGKACTPLLSTAEIVGLLAACPERKGSPSGPLPVQSRVGAEEAVAASGEGVEGGATGGSQHEKEDGSGDEEASSGGQEATGTGDAGPADTDDEDRDYYPLDHTYIRYSHEYSATGPTPHVLNTDNTPMYRSTVQADLPSFLSPPTHHVRSPGRNGSPEPPHSFTHNH